VVTFDTPNVEIELSGSRIASWCLWIGGVLIGINLLSSGIASIAAGLALRRSQG
jgi:hypothetical protein